MKVINKLVKKTLKLNKKRSIGTIIGIMLSVALVCAVSGMFASLRATIIDVEKTYSGDYHFCYVNIDADTVETLKHNRDIEKLETTGRLGFCMPKDTFIEINSINDIDNTVIPLKLVDGRMPENNHEIVLDEMALWQLDAKVGDMVTLDIGEVETSIDEDDIFHAEIVAPVSYEYTIVGKVAGDAYYTGYTVDTDNGIYDAYISFKNPKNYRESIRNILGYDLGDEEEEPYMASYVNAELLRWINMEFSDDTMRMLYNVIAVLIAIILITSVFCIKNSLDISVTEKMKTYGMLSSVGATKKQIRRSVLFEGAYLGMIGIPLGIALGETAVYVLCKIVGYFMQYLYNGSEGVDMICAMPLLPILLSVAMGALTIYLSTIMAAFKAGKVSPIENIRSNNEVKIKGSRLKAPKAVSKVFGIGGVIAYKNLKRSRRKYRTTIISLAVSVFVFITMSAFISEMKRQTSGLYTSFEYNVSFSVYSEDKDSFVMPASIVNSADKILCSSTYDAGLHLDAKDKMNYPEDDPDFEYYNIADDIDAYCVIVMMDDTTFEKYLESSGIEADGDTCVIYDAYSYRSSKTDKMKKARYTSFAAGDRITGTIENCTWDENGDVADVETYKLDTRVAGISDVKPFGKENVYYFSPIIVLNEKYYPELQVRWIYYYLDVEDAYKTADILNDTEGVDGVENIDEVVKANDSIILLMGIFMYGFIIVISLIGVTNIFNTITSNMELRQKEFAMLKSIGMTGKEFSRMVNLETLFYSSKALVFGIVLGLVASEFIHRGFNERLEDVFIFPGKAILISIIFVFVLVYIIMKYSIAKINRQNTIETIRKDTV